MTPPKSVRQAPAIDPDALKQQMREERAAGNTRYGGDGERILAEYLRDRGHVVEWVHTGGIDLSVDGQVNVDVKSHLALGRRGPVQPPIVPRAQRASGVVYPCVVFLDEVIKIYGCPLATDPDAVVELTWAQACAYLARTHRSIPATRIDPSGVRAAQVAACKTLQQWIEATWGLRAHIVFRGNPLAQASMARQGWGPEAFHQDVRKSEGKVDLVVLIYFDGKAPRTVFAYPLSLSSDIKWQPKPVGPNRNGRMTFDPKVLDPNFVFAGIEQFQQEFLGRFL